MTHSKHSCCITDSQTNRLIMAMPRAIDLADRELKLVFMIALCNCVACTSLQTEGSIIVQVQRRLSFDNYILNSSMGRHTNCDMINSTYLVNERQCVDDQELLFNGI